MSDIFAFGGPERAHKCFERDIFSRGLTPQAAACPDFSFGPPTPASIGPPTPTSIGPPTPASIGPPTPASFGGFLFGSTAHSSNRIFGTASSNDVASKSSKVFRQYKVFQDLKQLFQNKEDYDVIIKVKEREFKAHRTILAARSSVLKSTFQNNMKEEETKIMNIEDCDPSSFSDFLGFLYCGETKLSGENVFTLFDTADKYNVQDLREVCLEFMKENISVDSFCKTITLALEHSESELTTVATNYFIKNARYIVKTVAWQTFLAENVTKGNELVIKAFDAVVDLESPLFKKQRVM